MKNNTVALNLERETSVREIKRELVGSMPGDGLDDLLRCIEFTFVPTSFIRRNIEEFSVMERNLKKKIMSGKGDFSETPYLDEKEALKNKFPYGPIAEALVPELARLTLYASTIYYLASHIRV